MRILTILLAGAMIAAITGAAAAQPAPAPTPAPTPASDATTRMQLARQLLQVSGGEAATNAQIKVMFDNAAKVVGDSVPADQSKFAIAIQRDMQDEVMKLVPSIMDASVQAYADQLTTQELRDYVAWLSSDTGQAILHKVPLVQQEVLDRERPLMAQMIPTLQRKVVDQVCVQLKCTSKEHDTVAEAMAKAFPQSS